MSEPDSDNEIHIRTDGGTPLKSESMFKFGARHQDESPIVQEIPKILTPINPPSVNDSSNNAIQGLEESKKLADEFKATLKDQGK